MRRRTIRMAIAVVALAAIVAGVLLLRRRAAPEPARLLPPADAYLYFNLKPLRVAGLIGKQTAPIYDRNYAEFVRQTGFEFERDLDDAAFAVQAAPRRMEVEPGSSPEQFPRYSEVFHGHFDTQRAQSYFSKIAHSTEEYRETTIYQVPLEGRTVRVALLGLGMVAVSNTQSADPIHYIIDRYRELALPFGGPPLLRQFYPDVPLGSLIWGIARVNRGDQKTSLVLPGGYDLFFPANTVIVGSARYTTDVQVKIEAFTPSAGQAKQVVDQAGAFLGIFHGLESSMNPRGADPDVKAFFNSLKIQQEQSGAVLTATMTPAFLKKIFSEPSTEAITGSDAELAPKRPAKPAQQKAPRPSRRR